MNKNRLEWKETKQTPYILLDGIENRLIITGKSYMENTYGFYKPVMEWLEAFFKDAKQKVFQVTLSLIYFNSSSSKLLFDLFDLLDDASATNSVEVTWNFEKGNESAQEAGEDFANEFSSLNMKLNALDRK